MTQPGGGGNDEEERVRAEALKIIDFHQILPHLVVFDPDYTLAFLLDEMIHLYPQVKGIILGLKDEEIDMAIASTSPTSEIGKRFLHKFGIRSIFVDKGIYSSWTHKTEHFDKIHKTTGVLFDDEIRNIETVSKMDA